MENRHKILFVINDLGIGGAQRVVYEIAKRLPSAQYNVRVCTLKILPKEDRPSLVDLFKGDGIPVDSINAGQSFHLRDLFNLARYVRREKPHVIHAHLPLAVIVVALARVISGRFSMRIIAHEHNTYSLDVPKIRLARHLVEPLVSLTICYESEVEKEMFGDTALFAVGNHPTSRRSWTISNGVEVAAINNAVHTSDTASARASMNVRPNDTLVVSIGRLISWKGYKTLIEAATLAKRNLPSLQVRIVGDGPQREELAARIGELHIENVVRLCGVSAQPYTILAAADIVSAVFTYKPDLPVKISVGIAGFEAMAAGKALLVGDYPSVRAYVASPPAVYAVPPGDPAALARALVELANNAGRRAALGEAAHLYASRNLEWDDIVKKYCAIYNTLTS